MSNYWFGIVPSVIEPVLNEFFILKDDGWHRSPEDQTRERGGY